MDLKDFCQQYKNLLSSNSTFIDWIRQPFDKRTLYISGLNGSVKAFALSLFFEQSRTPFVIICDDEEEAAYLYNDVSKICGENVFLFPSSYKNNGRYSTVDDSKIILRTELLNRFSENQSLFIVTTVDALMEKIPSPKDIYSNTLHLSIGSGIDIEFIAATLLEYGFQQVDFVYTPGQFSVRGSIVDIFSFTSEYPYRIDVLGDVVDSIRMFDIEKQLSIKKIEQISILADIQNSKTAEKISILNYLPEETVLFSSVLKLEEQIETLQEKISGNNAFDTTKKTIERFSTYNRVEFIPANQKADIEFHIIPQILFHKNFDLLSEKIKQLQNEKFRIYIASDSEKQTDRIAAVFAERNDGIIFTPILHTLHEGFIDNDNKIAFFTDHQIFDRFHKFNLKTDRTRIGKAAMMLKELNQLQIGDYVVHIDHGVGRFGGLLKADINGKHQEVIKLIYKNDDVLFVSIHGLHRISKYRGKDGEPPMVSKLGSGSWEKIKERTKKKVKDIARDLIILYAKRLSEKGFQYSPDSYLQQELEASFLYEDTPDQVKVTFEVKKDMESEVPMDRLICGDVGFGKTEIAIRAAFKAVTDGKQVAVLVPTTVLAFQHYKTFSDRLKDFPCRIEYLSRLRKSSEIKTIISDNADGKIDIIIGTHRIIGKDIKFNDLGLLIIDEEQKFGVSVKEKLKQIKANIDTLTMTATPIPRTLQFSLMGARDLSILNTPPPNRYPIYTEIITFDENTIKEAVEKEIDRNGQVFFVHNHIQNMTKIETMLKRLLPNVRVAIAHGQMPPEQLEAIVMQFIDYEYDVLIATTVIESGIDIPNVNTIIINDAHRFGLTDLHQLRGRVGRSNRKAYCYLVAPLMKNLTNDAQRRLKALENFSDLGSGFNIAMQDLDIRGAGNMLGAEQSGFIADVGYETYQKILEEAVQELKIEEFSELYPTNKQQFVKDCNIESDLELMFPADYIENVAERMTLYRKLDNIKTEQELAGFKMELEDRFGKIPHQVEDLLMMVRLRFVAQQAGIEKLILKNGRCTAYLVANNNSNYYQSEIFGKILQYISLHPKTCSIREQNSKRSFTIQQILNIQNAFDIFSQIGQ